MCDTHMHTTIHRPTVRRDNKKNIISDSQQNGVAHTVTHKSEMENKRIKLISFRQAPPLSPSSLSAMLRSTNVQSARANRFVFPYFMFCASLSRSSLLFLLINFTFATMGAASDKCSITTVNAIIIIMINQRQDDVVYLVIFFSRLHFVYFSRFFASATASLCESVLGNEMQRVCCWLLSPLLIFNGKVFLCHYICIVLLFPEFGMLRTSSHPSRLALGRSDGAMEKR